VRRDGDREREDPDDREGVLRDLAAEAECSSGTRNTARTKATATRMDIRMPSVDGIDANRRLIRDGDDPRFLMLTTFDLDEYVDEAMKAGASGFLLKDAPRDQLVGAVRTVAAGDALLAPGLVRRLNGRDSAPQDQECRSASASRDVALRRSHGRCVRIVSARWP
jgi:DNA-binding NarL/FixJ family response regulator